MGMGKYHLFNVRRAVCREIGFRTRSELRRMIAYSALGFKCRVPCSMGKQIVKRVKNGFK